LTARGLREVLTELGFRWGGQQLEAMRREDPNAPANWSPTAWRQFFTILPIPAQESEWGGGGAAQSLQKAVQEAIALREEIVFLRHQLAQAKKQVAIVQTAVPSTPAAVPDTAALVPETHTARKPKNHKSSTRKTPPEAKDCNLVKVSLAFQPIVDEMRNLTVPMKPARFETRLSVENVRYRRQILALYLVACHGVNVRLMLDMLISAADGLSLRSGSIRRPVEQLGEKGLMVCETIGMTTPIETSLAFVRLSEDGKSLARIYGWEPVETDWERLIRLHQGDSEQMRAHTMAVLAFAMHARLRGYQTQIVPEISGKKASPDVLVEKDGEKSYVEVELSHKDLSQKWRNAKALQGRVAICTAGESARNRFVADSKALLKVKHGLATDLNFLIFSGQASPIPITSINADSPLWVDAW
jgi:hypothetical protein